MEEEEKTGQAAPPHGGCLFCMVLPMLERRWSEAPATIFAARGSNS